MMSGAVLKVETEVETCSICGAGGDLLTPEEHDASAAPMQTSMRSMLLHLNNNKVVPEGRLCAACGRRAAAAYEFSAALAARAAPPLSDKIRALRRRLHHLTQRIDVFIVVGGPGAGAGNAYSEDDIIMVEKDALAAATAADDDDLEHTKNAKGDTVYQCSVCPLSFQRAAEYRAHGAAHGPGARHSCWTCGAQLASRAALRDHAAAHAAPSLTACHLCGTTFQTAAELRRHEAACPATCPLCGAAHGSRAALGAHAAARHGRGAPPPHLCPACFRAFPAPDLLSAHLLRHRQAKQFVCGYGDCVLRFGTRSNLMAHIRKSHAAALPPDPAPSPSPGPAPGPAPPLPCAHCQRTFASGAALKRHMRVHRAPPGPPGPPAGPPGPADTHHYELLLQEEVVEGEQGALEYVMEEEEGDEEEVEYLEVETLEEADADMDQYEQKPDMTLMQ